MSLYTTTVGFDDFTQGIEQYEAATPEAAMAMFLREAECLKELAIDAREHANERHIKLLHLQKLEGVWLWLMSQSQVPKMKNVLGGQVVRTAQAPSTPKA